LYIPRPSNLGGYSRYNRTASSRIRRYSDTASNGRKKSTPKPPTKPKYGSGMPTSVQNILTKREEAKKVAATKPAPKPTPKPPVTSTNKAPVVNTTSIAVKPQTSTNQIYKKPTSTVTKPKQNKTVGKKLENIDLPKGIDKTVESKKKENSPVETKVKENKNNRPTNKIVLSENEPIYLTTREGKRIRIDHGHYKKEKPKTYQSLTVRKLLSSVEKRLQKNDKGIAASDYIKKGKPLSFRKVNPNKESSVLGANRTDTLVKTLLENSFTAGVARISGFNEGIILNYNKENNPIQINSQYDYENFLIEKVAANTEDTFSKKMLSYVQSKLDEDNSSNQIIPEYKSMEEGIAIARERASRLERIDLEDVGRNSSDVTQNVNETDAINSSVVFEEIGQVNEMYVTTNQLTQYIQHFLAQCRQEGSVSLTEAGWLTEEAVKDYTQKSEPGTSLGKALGNTEIGDGYLFRGADYVAEYLAWDAAGFWWSNNNMNYEIDNGATATEVSRGVNRGVGNMYDINITPSHLEERLNYYQKALEVIN
jgi:hypothetical protein